jgi:hypothetical protein
MSNINIFGSAQIAFECLEKIKTNGVFNKRSLQLEKKGLLEVWKQENITDINTIVETVNGILKLLYHYDIAPKIDYVKNTAFYEIMIADQGIEIDLSNYTLRVTEDYLQNYPDNGPFLVFIYFLLGKRLDTTNYLYVSHRNTDDYLGYSTVDIMAKVGYANKEYINQKRYTSPLQHYLLQDAVCINTLGLYMEEQEDLHFSYGAPCLLDSTGKHLSSPILYCIPNEEDVPQIGVKQYLDLLIAAGQVHCLTRKKNSEFNFIYITSVIGREVVGNVPVQFQLSQETYCNPKMKSFLDIVVKKWTIFSEAYPIRIMVHTKRVRPELKKNAMLFQKELANHVSMLKQVGIEPNI